MPTALCMPSTSSGLVSLRMRMTSSPLCVRSTASSAVNASVPVAAPGDAGRPLARTVAPFFAAAVKLGSSIWVRSSAGTRSSASVSEMSFSFTMSTAILTAAAPVRLPVRVWSMKSCRARS